MAKPTDNGRAQLSMFLPINGSRNPKTREVCSETSVSKAEHHRQTALRNLEKSGLRHPAD